MVLTDEVRSAWDDRRHPSALATVDEDGTPNVIWVTCTSLLDDGERVRRRQIGIADNYFSKTLANILRGQPGLAGHPHERQQAVPAEGLVRVLTPRARCSRP